MTEEKKPVQKQSKKQEAPKKVAPAPAAVKPVAKKVEVSKKILVGSSVKTPFDTRAYKYFLDRKSVV